MEFLTDRRPEIILVNAEENRLVGVAYDASKESAPRYVLRAEGEMCKDILEAATTYNVRPFLLNCLVLYEQCVLGNVQ